MASDGDPAIGKRSHLVAIAHQDVLALDPKGPSCKIASSVEVAEDLFLSPIAAGDAIVSWNGPHDVGGEKLSEGATVSTGVELILRIV